MQRSWLANWFRTKSVKTAARHALPHTAAKNVGEYWRTWLRMIYGWLKSNAAFCAKFSGCDQTFLESSRIVFKPTVYNWFWSNLLEKMLSTFFSYYGFVLMNSPCQRKSFRQRNENYENFWLTFKSGMVFLFFSVILIYIITFSELTFGFGS